jgi:hypothetical protein
MLQRWYNKCKFIFGIYYNRTLEKYIALREYDALVCDASWTAPFFSQLVSDTEGILECEPLTYYLLRRYKPVISIDGFGVKRSADASDTPLGFGLRYNNRA